MNETAEGRIGVFIDPATEVGAIVEMRCESAPVAKSEHFVELANDIAKQVAPKNPAIGRGAARRRRSRRARPVNDRIGEVVGLIRENMKVQRFAAARRAACSASTSTTTAPSACWCRRRATERPGRPARRVHAHRRRSRLRPRRDARTCPAELIAKEKEIAQAKAEATGKPAQIVEKIAEGR